MRIEEALPRLATAYHRGLLVPFLGAGMSVGVHPNWKDFVTGLEAEAGISGPNGKSAAGTNTSKKEESELSDALVRRANHALRVLLRRGSGAHITSVRRVLYGTDAPHAKEPTTQTTALARLWWPLVLTTNYDDLFSRAYERARRHEKSLDTAFAEVYGKADHYLQILGRSPRDCQRVLAALSETTTSILWTLHGYLPRDKETQDPDLAAQLVVGHEDYRRVAYAALHYHRAFAEVYRQRSLLFVGAALGDVYLLDLFAEVQELYGPGARPHYAMVLQGSVDPDFLRTRFGIVALEYESYDDLPKWLGHLHEEVSGPGGRQRVWAFDSARSEPTPNAATLVIREGRLPEKLSDDEALVVGASIGPGSGTVRDQWKPFFGKGIDHLLDRLARTMKAQVGAQWGPGPEVLKSSTPRDVELHRLRVLPEGNPLCRSLAVVTAWSDPKRRDLRSVGEATTAALW